MANLMLRKDIVDAVENGEFHIWAITHVTQTMELLLGKTAGSLSQTAAPNRAIFSRAFSASPSKAHRTQIIS